MFTQKNKFNSTVTNIVIKKLLGGIRKMKILALIILTLSLIGCGTDDSGGSGTSTTIEPIELVSGTYSYWSSDISYKCNDGSSGTLEPEAKNIEVLFYDNAALEVIVDDITFYEGIYDGITEVRFNVAAEPEADYIDDFGNIEIHRKLIGKFTAGNKWSGELDVRVYYLTLGVTCDFDNTFEGELLE